MTDDDAESPGVPDSDPRHIDPAGDLADAVESGEFDIRLPDDTDREELRKFIDAVESSDEPTDPGDEAVVRIARALLDEDRRDES